jgi:hypothetical protein
VGAGIGDKVDDKIDVGGGMDVAGGASALLEWGLEFVLGLAFVQIWGVQLWMFNFGWVLYEYLVSIHWWSKLTLSRWSTRALLFSRKAIKTTLVGGEECSRCGRLSGNSGNIGVEVGDDVGGEVGDGVIDVGVAKM